VAKATTEMERSGIEVHGEEAKATTEMERSGIEVHGEEAKATTDAWTLGETKATTKSK